MWKKLIASAGLTTVLCFGPAMAQDTMEKTAPPANMEQSGQQTKDHSTMMQEKVNYEGWPVYSSDGRNLGNVSKVIYGDNGKVAAIQTDIGGFLGLGAKTVELKSDQFTAGEKRLNLSLNADQVRDLPEVAE